MILLIGGYYLMNGKQVQEIEDLINILKLIDKAEIEEYQYDIECKCM